MFTTREKKKFTTDIEFNLQNYDVKNKLIYSLNEKDFLEINSKTQINNSNLNNMGDTSSIFKLKSNQKKLNEDEFQKYPYLDSNKNSIIFNENSNVNNNIKERNKSYENIDCLKSIDADKTNDNNILKTKIISVEYNSLDDLHNDIIKKINNLKSNTSNIDNNEISQISKFSYTNFNSQQNSVLLNLGKKESINFSSCPRNNNNFKEEVNNNLQDILKDYDNSELISSINNTQEIRDGIKKEKKLLNNINEYNIQNSNKKFENVESQKLLNSFKKDNLHSKNYKSNIDKINNEKTNNVNKIIDNNILNLKLIEKSNNLNKDSYGYDSNNEKIQNICNIKNYSNTDENNNLNNKNFISLISHSNNLIFSKQLNPEFQPNFNKINNNNNTIINYSETNTLLESKSKGNFILTRPTNNIHDNGNNNQYLSPDNSISENNSSLGEFKKNEISESLCEYELNNSTIIDNKSEISSNVLSHIHTPKMLTGVKSDMSFVSYHSRSENNSRIETLNNIGNLNTNNYLNLAYINNNLPTDMDNYLNINSTNYNNNNLQNCNEYNSFNQEKVRYHQNYIEDQEFEMLHDNNEAFKYIETPKSNKFKNLNVNQNSNSNNFNNNYGLSNLNNPLIGSNIFNSLNEKVVYGNININPLNNLQVISYKLNTNKIIFHKIIKLPF